MAYESFNTTIPSLTATLADGAITAISVSNTHDYFRRAPTLTIENPETINFVQNETVQQTLSSGVVISAEVAEWKSDTGELKVIHLGADDGNFHTFITTQTINGVTSGMSVIPATISEENQISENEQNSDFEEAADSFLDFTETNPFGDPNES